MKKEFTIHQIGIIHSPFKSKDECSIQGKLNPDIKGKVEVFPEYLEGLETIDTFSHIILFYIFDQAGEIILSRPTFLDDSNHGVFASRHPCRPNGIGISTVKLVNQDRNILEVSGIDILDNTPLIDIKPLIPRFDTFEDATNGWVEGKPRRSKPVNRE